ncbi:MAG: hypothetical protein JWO41_117 [Candidatus Saccharibacteria bacterium]|nr:hypothetical protein [Candidatus Saccharibacteria bacterium]
MTQLMERADLSVPAPRSEVDGQCKKAWKNHGSALRVEVNYLDPHELNAQLACCPPADDTRITVDTAVDNTIPLSAICPAVPPRESRRARKLRLIEEDKRKRASEPRKGTTLYTDSTKAGKHGNNVNPPVIDLTQPATASKDVEIIDLEAMASA